MPQIEPLKWEPLPYDQSPEAIYFTDKLFRLKVPGGWLVKSVSDVSTYQSLSIGTGTIDRREGWEGRAAITFIPDPQYVWLTTPVADSAHEAV